MFDHSQTCACFCLERWDGELNGYWGVDIFSVHILTPPAQAADITGLLSYLRPFGIVPLPPSPLRFLPPFLC